MNELTPSGLSTAMNGLEVQSGSVFNTPASGTPVNMEFSVLHRMGTVITQMTQQAIEAKNYFTFGNSLPYILQALICSCEL